MKYYYSTVMAICEPNYVCIWIDVLNVKIIESMKIFEIKFKLTLSFFHYIPISLSNFINEALKLVYIRTLFDS